MVFRKLVLVLFLSTLSIISVIYSYLAIPPMTSISHVPHNNNNNVIAHQFASNLQIDDDLDTSHDNKIVVGSTSIRKRVNFAKVNKFNNIRKKLKERVSKREQRNLKNSRRNTQQSDNGKYHKIRNSIINQRENKVNYHSMRSEQGKTNRERAMQQFRRQSRFYHRGGRKKKNNAKTFKDEYIYCNITETPSISNLLIKYNEENKNQLTMDRMNELKQIRLTKPKSCDPNRAHSNRLKKLNINLDDEHNLVPYINRCKVMGYKNQPDLFEYFGHSKTKIGYIHVFKAAGSTVIKTWQNIHKQFGKIGPKKGIKLHWRYWNAPGRYLPRAYNWVVGKDYFYKNIFNKQYIFSFVRDPISRFLSGFFEYTVRGNDKVESNYMDKINDKDKSPLHLINELTFIMQHRMKCEYQRKYETDNEYEINPLNIYWDDHLNPQIHFLLNDEWNPYKLNYVGFVENVEESVYNILMEYSNIKPNDLSFERYTNEFYERARDRHNKEYQQRGDGKGHERHSELRKEKINPSDLVLEINELNHDLVRKICELYWLDYICLPFDIPIQCNLTDLFLQHYGNHVVYNQCYQ